MTMLKLFSILVILMLYYPKTYCFLQNSGIVKTQYGLLNGSLDRSRDGIEYYSYKGIPYAKPPIGNLRFRAPEPPVPWDGIKNVHNHSSVCIQKDLILKMSPEVEGSEDCLYLNVYAPKNSKDLLPVMVFIHYGAFISGSGNEDRLGPQYFMDKDVIMVTFNYRLGVMGFLSTGDDASPGNFALKDQAAAMKWVKNNIRDFGGDNNKITLFGQSAGAGSVHLHMLSPLSKGLFQKAISQSGSALSLWASPLTDLQKIVAQTHAKDLGCKNNTNEEMIDCLRKIDAKTLVESSDKQKFYFVEPLNLYTPVLEKKTESNPEPFLTETPLSIIQSGKFAKIPWILGVTSGEGILRASPFLRNKFLRDPLNDNFNQLVPNLIGVPLSVLPTQVPNVWESIKKEYFGDENVVNVTNQKSVQNFINLYSDRAFLYGSYQSVLLHASKGHNDLWFYNFDYRGTQSYGDLFALTNDDINFKWGVCHCDDLIYLFKSSKYLNKLTSKADNYLSRIMIQLWTNFAIFGNPTPGNSVRKYAWEKVKNMENETTLYNSYLHYLNISGPYDGPNPIKLEINNQYYPKRMSFYESLPLFENVANIS